MSAQAPQAHSEGPPARRRGRVVGGTAVVVAAAVIALLVVSQLRWLQQPLCIGGAQTQTATAVRLSSAADSSEQEADAEAAAAPAPVAADAAQQQQAALPPDFRFKKVAAIIAFDRFEYFRRVVDGLRQAWGSHEYIVTITIDGPPSADGQGSGGGQPGSKKAGGKKGGGKKGSKSSSDSFNREGWEAIVAYAHHLQWLAAEGRGSFKEVIVNASEANLGVWPNKKRAVAGAMELSDFVVVLEDDIVLERDALRWFEWHVTSGLIFDRPEIAVATCWSSSFPYHSTAVEGHDLLVVREMGLLDKFWVDHWAQPWGWATWRRTWDAVGAGWSGQDIKLARAIQAQGWFETMPLVSRCNNIGSVGFHKKGAGVGHIHQRALTSASFPNLDRCAYRELPRANYTSHLGQEPLYTDVVRRGILPDTKFGSQSLEEHRQALRQFREQHPEPSNWQSTC